MKILDFSDETIKININGYFISRLYIVVVIIDEIVYKFFSESLKKLFIKL